MAQLLFQQSTAKSAETPSGPGDFFMSRPRKADSTLESWIGWNLKISEQSEVANWCQIGFGRMTIVCNSHSTKKSLMLSNEKSEHKDDLCD